MKKDFAKIFLILQWGLFCLLAGCTKIASNDGAYTVRIPLDDHTGHYSLQNVTLHTVTDIRAMSGTTAVMLANGQFHTYADQSGVEHIESADLGSSPSAQFVQTDGILHPADFFSLTMATTMYHFESIKNFYDLVHGNDGLSFPRTILMNVTVAHDDQGQESDTVNNAAYVPGLDLFWINPFKDADVPLAFNGGVLAHEYLHSVFQARLQKANLNSINQGSTTAAAAHKLEKIVASLQRLNEWVSAGQPPTIPQSPSGPATPITLNHDQLVKVNGFIFGGLNEGIADYFGYEYSRNPGWITPSLPSQSFRDLSIPKNFSMNSVMQQKIIMNSFHGTGASAQSQLDVHWLGSYFSRMLYLVSQEWGSLETEQATITFMDRYAARFSTDNGKRYISMGELVKLFFQDRLPDGSLCENVKQMFTGELADGSFQCEAPSNSVVNHP